MRDSYNEFGSLFTLKISRPPQISEKSFCGHISFGVLTFAAARGTIFNGIPLQIVDTVHPIVSKPPVGVFSSLRGHRGDSTVLTVAMQKSKKLLIRKFPYEFFMGRSMLVVSKDEISYRYSRKELIGMPCPQTASACLGVAVF
jgi:hypothetical protein